MTLTYIDFSLLAILVGIVQFLLSIWIKSRLENSIKHEYDKLIEEYKVELNIKDRASKVAEYLAITIGGRMDLDIKMDIIRANQLAWELALWLPDDLYLELKESLNPLNSNKDSVNEFKTLIKIREFLRKEKTKLTDNDIFFNQPSKK